MSNLIFSPPLSHLVSLYHCGYVSTASTFKALRDHLRGDKALSKEKNPNAYFTGEVYWSRRTDLSMPGSTAI